MKRIFLIAPLLTLAACHKQQEMAKNPATPVRVTAVDMHQPKSSARYTASILPGRKVSLMFRVSGLVTEMHKIGGRGLESGDYVAAGTVLAQLRAEEYRLSSAQAVSQVEGARESLRAAAAQLAQAQASRAKAEADFKRSHVLWESKSITRPEYDAARAQLDVTTAQVDAARAQWDAAAAHIRTAEANAGTAKLAQADSSLIAPFNASVVQRNVELGMLVGPSVVAYTLADIGTVKAAFGVPDTVMVQLRQGRQIGVTVEALPGREFRGTVSSIASVADPDTRLFQVEVTIVNHQTALKPGMIASLELENSGPAQAVPVIPLSAVVRDRTNPSDFAVMVVEGKVAKARKVGLGQTFGELLAVTSGLKPGELVVRAGGTLVNDGDAVEVLR